MTTAGTIHDDPTFSDDSGVIQIKRYPNRRFYDRSRRKYVTHQEIEELVHRGQTIEVRDSRSDEDLTRLVLTQILLERHPERMDLFPIGMLHLMLRANDLALEFVRVFLRFSMVTLENLQGPRTLSPFMTPYDWMKMFLPGFSPGPRQGESPAGASVELLSRRVAELEDRIRQLEGGPDGPRLPRVLEDHKSR